MDVVTSASIDPAAREMILNKLSQIEQDFNVRILYACESGSRAWGFASHDSDLDVRFIYAHPVDWYLTVDEQVRSTGGQRDVIEIPVTPELDINGFDIRKALRLARGHNTIIGEWLKSPIHYRSVPGFVEGFTDLLARHYRATGVIHHHRALAKKAMESLSISDDKVHLKRLLYGLRSMAVIHWVFRNPNQPPPIDLLTLLEGSVLTEDHGVRASIKSVVARKRELGEKGAVDHDMHSRIALAHLILEMQMVDLWLGRGENNAWAEPPKMDPAELDVFFRSTIKGV